MADSGRSLFCGNSVESMSASGPKRTSKSTGPGLGTDAVDRIPQVNPDPTVEMLPSWDDEGDGKVIP